MTALRLVDSGRDVWGAALGAEPLPPSAGDRRPRLLGPDQWRALAPVWPEGTPVGLVFANDVDIEAPIPALARLSLIVLRFPKQTDGRAYSQARLLRSRHGWRGELRAVGDVLVDMLPLLLRTGFDSAVLRDDQSAADALRLLAAWSPSAAHGQAQASQASQASQAQTPGVTPFPGTYQQDGRAPSAGQTPVAGQAFALYAREREGHASRVASAVALLRQAAAEHPGAIVQASSLGVEDMAVSDLIVRHRLPIAIAMIDTGRLHPETVALRAQAQAHWGVDIEVHHPPREALLRFVARHGPQPMYESIALREACCEVRKLQPLQELLAGRSAWVTGLRHEQSATRAAAAPRARDAGGREKFSPLLAWSWEDVWHYVRVNGVPYNPLHDAFMPSIGCAPCTRAITPGEDLRAGRWWWESESHRECGLHPVARAGHPAAAARA